MGMQLGNWQKDATPEQLAAWRKAISKGLRRSARRRETAMPDAPTSLRTNGQGRFTALNLAVLRLDKDIAALTAKRQQLVQAQALIDQLK